MSISGFVGVVFLNHLCDGELHSALSRKLPIFLNHLCDGEQGI
ncbi:hypothetical protein ENHYDAX1_220291 [Enhydrobacter sp. AX1]|nr:hypothetical protein ENHYDAX1_220291 [Enhydrobacter sp. AX1]